MTSENILEQFNKYCLNQEDCDKCDYNCKNKSDIMECAAWFGYNKAIDDVINEIVSVKSEVAEKEPYDDHLFTVLAQRQNEIIDLIQKLKGGGSNECNT